MESHGFRLFTNPPPRFNYLEAANTIYQKNIYIFTNSVVVETHPRFRGATLTGTICTLKKTPLSENLRASAGRKFMMEAATLRMKLHYADNCNFIIHQSAVSRFWGGHAWNLDPALRARKGKNHTPPLNGRA